MTTRVAFVGNSHLAALKEGLAELAGPLRFEPRFFGIGGRAIEEIEVEGSALVGGSPTLAKKLSELWGTDTFDLAAVDAVCLVGMGASVRTLAPLGVQFQSTDYVRPGRHVLSRQTFVLAAGGLFETTVPFGGIARKVRRATGRPVYALAQPAPDETFLAGDEARAGSAVAWLKDAAAGAEAAHLVAMMEEALVARFGLAGVVAQPAETLASPITTRSAFMRGSRRLGKEEMHEETDTVHANASYGACVLAVLDRLFGGESAPSPGLAVAA